MTIEEKAKACDSNYKVYTELINRLENVKDAIKKQNYGIAMDVLCKPYPEFQVTTHSELKDSEDERIRKAIGYAIGQSTHSDGILINGVSSEEALAWLEKQGNLMKALQISNAKIGELIEKNYYLKEQLEKQGEQKTVIKMKTPEESLGIDSDTYNKIVDECIYGEQKPIKEHNACEFCEDRYGCVNPCSMKLIEEQKPAWSEEDIELLDNTIKFIEDRVAATSPSLRTYSPTLTGKEIPFLKSLKDRVQPQPKQELSEEDERLFQIIIDILDRENHLGNLSHTDLIACVKKLKSLRPQATWKPSEEQLKAIKWIMDGDSPENWIVTLANLYNDLKKLK